MFSCSNCPFMLTSEPVSLPVLSDKNMSPVPTHRTGNAIFRAKWTCRVPCSKINEKFKMVPTEGYGRHRAPLCLGPCVSVPDQGAGTEQWCLQVPLGPRFPVQGAASCLRHLLLLNFWLGGLYTEPNPFCFNLCPMKNISNPLRLLIQSPPLFLLLNEFSSVAVSFL